MDTPLDENAMLARLQEMCATISSRAYTDTEGTNTTNTDPANEPDPVLVAALGEGDPQQVRALIAAGANIHYKNSHGGGALIDAVHGRDVARDQRLLELLALLIEHGVELSGINNYQETGLRALSRWGRFDAVRMLIDAGADKSQLQWTPLMEAVALGSLTDMKTVFANGAELENRDGWSRTAWLLAIHTGEIAKAQWLLAQGADPQVCGSCNQPPLFYAIQSHSPEMLQWLLDQGADVHQSDQFGCTAIVEAVRKDDIKCLEILIRAGADWNSESCGVLLPEAHSRAMILRLLEAGADPAGAKQRVLFDLNSTHEQAWAGVAHDDFNAHYTHKFGIHNPEKMTNAFWEAQIRCGASAYSARNHFARDADGFDEPVWSADRFGQSFTLLPAGGGVRIGGEHEDFYDPDFCIYNDVFVHMPDGSITIYGYPEADFPPTDFHTATLMGNAIYIIGGLGYHGKRAVGPIPVFRLNLDTFHIERLHPTGDVPSWLYEHRAVAQSAREIRVWNGKAIQFIEGEEDHQENLDTFILDIEQLQWCREERREEPSEELLDDIKI